jgi:hypothetical protein
MKKRNPCTPRQAKAKSTAPKKENKKSPRPSLEIRRI